MDDENEDDKSTSVLMYQMSNVLKGHVDVASLKYSRNMHACTIFGSSAHNGRPVAIAAGSEGGPGEKTAEVWDITMDGSSWEESMPTSCIFLLFLPFTKMEIIAKELSQKQVDILCN